MGEGQGGGETDDWHHPPLHPLPSREGSSYFESGEAGLGIQRSNN